MYQVPFRLIRPVFLSLAAVIAVGLHAQSDGSMTSIGSGSEPAAPINVQPQAPVVTVSKPAVQSPQGSSAPSPDSPPSIPVVAVSPGQGAQAAVNGDYVIRGGDTIEMIVYREQDLSIRSKVGKDGMVQLPLLGEVKMGGLTVRAATALIRAKYNADYLVEPQIYLNVAAYNATKFTIIGQVNKPGAYEYSESEPLGLLEAIGMAGGFTRIADRGHVIVKRREGGMVRTMKVNAKKLTDSGIDQFLIQSGDVINIGESWY
jgi:polysaccharide export outer membrane protein